MENYEDPTIEWFQMWADAKTLLRRERIHQWRLKNPDKRRAQEKRRNTRRMLTDPDKWRAKVAERMANWRAANPDKYAAIMSRWRKKHYVHFRAYRAAHYKKNADIIKATVKK